MKEQNPRFTTLSSAVYNGDENIFRDFGQEDYFYAGNDLEQNVFANFLSVGQRMKPFIDHPACTECPDRDKIQLHNTALCTGMFPLWFQSFQRLKQNAQNIRFVKHTLLHHAFSCCNQWLQNWQMSFDCGGTQQVRGFLL